MNQKRVAKVLASLVGALTLSAAVLLLLEGDGLGNAPAQGLAYQGAASIAQMIQPAAPLQAGVWQHIIIYESGDSAGSAASLADGQFIGKDDLQSNTVRPRANFHFVIDSAQSRHGDAMDGELEVGTTWEDQKPGAPYAGWPDVRYHFSSPYINAVGVCLIGDVNREPPSEAQQRNLIQVVRELQTRLNIPQERVRFQWEIEPNLSHATPAQKAFAEHFRASLEQASLNQ